MGKKKAAYMARQKVLIKHIERLVGEPPATWEAAEWLKGDAWLSSETGSIYAQSLPLARKAFKRAYRRSLKRAPRANSGGAGDPARLKCSD